MYIDESMVKSYHADLKWKMKIIRKPRPKGKEFKTLSDGRSKIVLHLELHEGNLLMQEKPFVAKFGATTATCLRLTRYWRSSGRVVVGDSWFGSVKSAIQMMLVNGLYSIFLVKTTHKLFPKQFSRRPTFKEENGRIAIINDVKLLAVKYEDLQTIQFVSTYSASSAGDPRPTRHHGLVPRPKVASDNLKFAAGIDIHSHVRTESKGLDDVLLTKDAHLRQFTGVMRFLFTNAFLAMKHFIDKDLKHLNFKMNLVNQMNIFSEQKPLTLRMQPEPVKELCRLQKKGERIQKMCFVC